MRRPHTWSMLRDACIACRRTRQEIVEHEVFGCDGTLRVREWWRNGVYTVEPIDPAEPLHAALDDHFKRREARDV